jgi:acyl-coenzyme A thioesterase PaaI-like protein
VLTVEFKINLLEPAQGSRFVARGRVVRAGRRLTTCRGEVVAVANDDERLVAVTTTTIALRPRAASS